MPIRDYLLVSFFLLAFLPAGVWGFGKKIQQLKNFKPYEGGDFFGDAVPDDWETHGGRLAPSQERWREGKSALRWDWQGAAWIRIGMIPYGVEESVRPKEWKTPGDAIRLAQSRETAPDISLWTYREGEASNCRFTIWLMHQGKALRFPFDSVTAGSWRGIRTKGLDQMLGDKNLPDGMTLREGEMAIAAPQEGSGTLWLDRLRIQRSRGSHYAARDEQTTWLPPTVHHWHHHFEAMQQKSSAGITVTEQEVRDVEALRTRFIEQVVFAHGTVNVPDKKDYLAIAKRLYEQYGLRRDGNVVHGLPMGTGSCLAGYPGEVRARGEFSPDWRGPYYAGMDTLFVNALLACHHAPSPESKQLFIDVVDYMHYNGFDAGSSGAVNYNHYYAGFNWVVVMSVLVQDVLQEHGRLERFRQWARYVSCTGDIYDERDLNLRVETMNSTDVFGASTRMRLASILLDDDPQRRAVDVKYLLRLLRKQLAYNVNGCADMMKPDHSVWHHAYTTRGYWGRNFGRAQGTMKAIKLSPFANNPDFQEAYWRYAKGMEAYDAFTGQYSELSRFLAGDERLGAGLKDIRLYPVDGQGLPPKHRILLPYNWGHFAGYFRNGNVWTWTALSRQNVLDAHFHWEAGGSFPQCRKIAFEGFQPIYAPGATLPLDEKRHLDRPGKGQLLVIRGREFTGSVAMNDYGILSYRFADPKFPELEGVSSKFVIDDVVVCLGAGIESSGDQPVATTIMQAPVGSQLRALGAVEQAWYDEKDRLAFAALGERSVSIRDEVISGGEQADVHVVYHDHGREPRGDTYAYGIVLDVEKTDAPGRAKALRDGEGAKILANTASLHSVAFGKHVAYAAFDAQEALPGSEWLLGIDAPGLMMIRDDGDSIQLSYIDPRILTDENRDYFRSGASALRTVRIRFRHPIVLQTHNQAEYKRLPNGSATDPWVESNVLEFDTNNGFTHVFRIAK